MDVDARDARRSAATRAPIGHVMLAIDTKVRARGRRARGERRARETNASRDWRDVVATRAGARRERAMRTTRKERGRATVERERWTDDGTDARARDRRRREDDGDDATTRGGTTSDAGAKPLPDYEASQMPVYDGETVGEFCAAAWSGVPSVDSSVELLWGTILLPGDRGVAAVGDHQALADRL